MLYAAVMLDNYYLGNTKIDSIYSNRRRNANLKYFQFYIFQNKFHYALLYFYNIFFFRTS